MGRHSSPAMQETPRALSRVADWDDAYHPGAAPRRVRVAARQRDREGT
jgi:hypothetical protein